MNESLSSIESFVESFISNKNDTSSEVSFSGGNDHENSLIDPVREGLIVQRNNLVSLLKLTIKNVFKHRVKSTVTPECKVYFEHLFILLEKTLQHGLKQRKQMFAQKPEAWHIIELVGKHSKTMFDIVESARHLPKIRTSNGRVRAWFRLVTMKKQLSDFFQILIDLRQTYLRDYYEYESLLMSEDVNLIAGLLIGMNSFDYYVYIKDETLDVEPILDLQSYLRDYDLDFCDDSFKNCSTNYKKNNDDFNDQDNILQNNDSFDMAEDKNIKKNLTEIEDEQTLKNLMEQNSYMEEINKQLTSTIKNLESKIEVISEKSNNFLDQTPKNIIDFGTVLANKEKQIMEEEKLRQDLSKKLKLVEASAKETETARELLERDIHEKKDTIVNLREQLDEIKKINLQIFTKMKDKDKEIKYKDKIIQEFENNNSLFRKEILSLEKKIHQQNDTTTGNKDLLEHYEKINYEQQEEITRMKIEIEELRMKTSINANLKEAYNLLKKKYEENELALEEIGKQLHDSTLEIENLKEFSGHLKEASWTNDKEVKKCKQCERDFSIAKRKHHCRNCGDIFCSACSNNEMPLPSSRKPVRVCDHCHAFLLERYSNTT